MSAVSTRDQCMLGVNERFVTEKSCVCLCACRTCARCRAIKREASTNARLMTRICRSCGDALSAEAQVEHRARVCCAHQAEHIVRLASNMRVQLAFGVALGLDEDRKAHGFEAYLGETIQECIDRSTHKLTLETQLCSCDISCGQLSDVCMALHLCTKQNCVRHFLTLNIALPLQCTV